MTDSIPQSFSLKDWNLGIWFVKNKDSIKTVLSLILGVLGTSFGNNTFMSALFGGATAVGTKLILDTFDYFVTANPQ